MDESKQPSSWELSNTPDGGLQILFYSSQGEILMSLSLESEDAIELLGLINEEVIIDSNQSETWSLRIPENNKETIVLTTIKGNKVISNLPLDKESSLKIVDSLSQFLGKKNKNQIVMGKNGPLLIGIIVFLSIIIIGGIIAGLTIYQQFATQIQSLQQISNSIG
jgi:hypothetical protein